MCCRSYRVPNLELDRVVVDGDHPGGEDVGLDVDGAVMDGLEPLVGELQQQARLANSCTGPQTSSQTKAGGIDLPD
jgi:hypothetical protein